MGTKKPVRPAALVLAAGAGSRFGGGKVTASLGGRPLLAHLLDTLSGLDLKVIGVIREGDEAARSLFEERRFRVTAIPPGEQSDSIRAGVRSIGRSRAYLILLADQPLVGKDEIQAVLEAWEEGAQAVLLDGGRGPQPPAAFDGSLREALLQLKGDRGAKRMALGLGASLAVIRVPAGLWMVDVDTPQELSELEKALGGPRAEA